MEKGLKKNFDKEKEKKRVDNSPVLVFSALVEESGSNEEVGGLDGRNNSCTTGKVVCNENAGGGGSGRGSVKGDAMQNGLVGNDAIDDEFDLGFREVACGISTVTEVSPVVDGTTDIAEVEDNQFTGEDRIRVGQVLEDGFLGGSDRGALALDLGGGGEIGLVENLEAGVERAGVARSTGDMSVKSGLVVRISGDKEATGAVDLSLAGDADGEGAVIAVEVGNLEVEGGARGAARTHGREGDVRTGELEGAEEGGTGLLQLIRGHGS